MKLINVSSKYGAPMGRYTNTSEPSHPVKFRMVKLRMSGCGAYDYGGAYWGCGEPLYWAKGDGAEEVQEVFVRAWSRREAKQKVTEIFKNCKFYK